jgi:hypothetical protein
LINRGGMWRAEIFDLFFLAQISVSGNLRAHVRVSCRLDCS